MPKYSPQIKEQWLFASLTESTERTSLISLDKYIYTTYILNVNLNRIFFTLQAIHTRSMPIMNMDDKDGKLKKSFNVLKNLIIAKIQFICNLKN